MSFVDDSDSCAFANMVTLGQLPALWPVDRRLYHVSTWIFRLALRSSPLMSCSNEYILGSGLLVTDLVLGYPNPCPLCFLLVSAAAPRAMIGMGCARRLVSLSFHVGQIVSWNFHDKTCPEQDKEK